MDTLFKQSESAISIAPGAYWLPDFALPMAEQLWRILSIHFNSHPPQHMMTPMGYPMSVRTTSFGAYGWVGSARGYAYSTINPLSQQAWPAIPVPFLALAEQAGLKAGYPQFVPDTCLINIYGVGSKMGLHQDKNECDFTQPIISVSLGIPATFLFGGANRSDKTVKIPLNHGDVVVWGGDSRKYFHGVSPIKPNKHPLLGMLRCNLTFRKAG